MSEGSLVSTIARMPLNAHKMLYNGRSPSKPENGIVFTLTQVLWIGIVVYNSALDDET